MLYFATDVLWYF